MKVNSYKRDRGSGEKVCRSYMKYVLYSCNLIDVPRVSKEALFLKKIFYKNLCFYCDEKNLYYRGSGADL